MASRAGYLLGMPLDDCGQTEAWLRALAAKGRSKKLEDTDDKKEVTDLFLSEAGVEAIRQVSLMAAPLVLEEQSFANIQKSSLKRFSQKKD